MALFDTHCHYNLEPLWPDWRSHWQAAQTKGIHHSVVIGTSVSASQRAIEIASDEPELWAAVGIHPEVYQSLIEDPESVSADDHDFTVLTQLATAPKVVAIGECGLDYFRLPDDEGMAMTIKARQQAGFIQHIKLADQLELPMVIHVRDTGDSAYWQVLRLLKEHKHSEVPFVLHCISGPLDYVKAALEMGAYIGVAGNVTYKNADHIRSLVKTTPADRLLLETDAPFLPPVPHRGKPCEPWMVSLTAEFLHQELGIDPTQLTENAKKVFSS